jgi:hypothetical protein
MKLFSQVHKAKFHILFNLFSFDHLFGKIMSRLCSSACSAFLYVRQPYTNTNYKSTAIINWCFSDAWWIAFTFRIAAAGCQLSPINNAFWMVCMLKQAICFISIRRFLAVRTTIRRFACWRCSMRDSHISSWQSRGLCAAADYERYYDYNHGVHFDEDLEDFWMRKTLYLCCRLRESQ